MNLHLHSLPRPTRERRSDDAMSRLASLLVAASDGSDVPPNATLRFEIELLAINPR